MPEVINLLLVLIQVYSIILLVRIVLSWLPNANENHELVAMLHKVTEPVLEPVRRAIPPLGMMDLSPLIVLVGLHLLRSVLADLANRM
ncbi:MAG: hypothetical protein CMJ64_11945 [Planctomycetaceae bacterium]|nr:hypothetical protein [Planctomycetaceae bacterium]